MSSTWCGCSCSPASMYGATARRFRAGMAASAAQFATTKGGQAAALLFGSDVQSRSASFMTRMRADFSVQALGLLVVLVGYAGSFRGLVIGLTVHQILLARESEIGKSTRLNSSHVSESRMP